MCGTRTSFSTGCCRKVLGLDAWNAGESSVAHMAILGQNLFISALTTVQTHGKVPVPAWHATNASNAVVHRSRALISGKWIGETMAGLLNLPNGERAVPVTSQKHFACRMQL